MTVASNAMVYSRPWLAKYQLDAIFCRERYSIIEATSKAGKTVGCIVWLTEMAMAGRDGHNFWWVAPIFPQAKIAFRRLKRALPKEAFEANESELTITLRNGAVIWFKGADKPDSLYGEDVFAAVIDEACRCKEEAWHAVRSTLTATRGPIRIIGNVKGRKNWAYKLARLAESGEPGMHYAKITALDAAKAIKPDGRPIVPTEEFEDAKRLLPEAVFRELYMAEPSDDAGNPFGIEAIQKLKSDLSILPPVVFGLDLAKSVDWTVLIGLDRHGKVCLFHRWQGPWEETIKRVLGIVGSASVLVDSTGVGDPVLEALQKQGQGQGASFIGYHFTSSSKQRLMEGLAVAIQQGRTSYPDGPIVSELESFEYEYKRTGVSYSAPEGLHDDCVCALALAVQHYGDTVGAWTDAVPGSIEKPSEFKFQFGYDPSIGDDGEDEDATAGVGATREDGSFREKRRHRFGY